MKKIEAILQEVGKITLKFSRLEHLALEYISVLISGVDTVDNHMIFQNDSLDKKLENLKKLIHLKSNGHREEQQLETISKIKNFKNKRNLFIHGDWGNIENAIEYDFETISVIDTKTRYNQQLDNAKNITEKGWSPQRKINFTILDLKEIQNDIDLLNSELIDHINSNRNTNK
ncbi:hypothetical protein [Sunxiuqinia rutila]|uniref:hypothetical protein n=1 Tax=Sunxiuqinia rutila TaxID=1397841 RepID=UPI003D366F51